jgi:hypothetical protein
LIEAGGLLKRAKSKDERAKMKDERAKSKDESCG